jgi:hypothetical protein
MSGGSECASARCSVKYPSHFPTVGEREEEKLTIE